MGFKKEVKDAAKQLTIVGKIFMLPLFCLGCGASNLSKKADGWLLTLGRFFSKLMFKQ